MSPHTPTFPSPAVSLVYPGGAGVPDPPAVSVDSSHIHTCSTQPQTPAQRGPRGGPRVPQDQDCGIVGEHLGGGLTEASPAVTR